ncbi:hypothetical protein ACFC09_29405 [Streptomyces sp. NPDC056161]|uniref:hypothetical protein n=1 Tax=Streptomyces sp. NPDC056161 TaxID=3345732 RepID=UPI0035D5AD1D
MTGVEEFRTGARGRLRADLTGEFTALRGPGGPRRAHEEFPGRLAGKCPTAAAGWRRVGRPTEYGGRAGTLEQQVAFHEEYALAEAPDRVGRIGERLLGSSDTIAERALGLPEGARP